MYTTGELKQTGTQLNDVEKALAHEQGRASSLESSLAVMKQDLNQLQDEKTSLLAKVGNHMTFTICRTNQYWFIPLPTQCTHYPCS